MKNISFPFFVGDVPLDLSDKHFLSMDWKNSEKLTPYVLVQTKPLVS